MKLVFECATIADIIRKAAKVAPTSGNAFDKANGILVTVEAGEVIVRATNLSIFYLEKVDPVSVDGEGEWRLPSTVLDGLCSKLPVGTGKEVTFEDDGAYIHLTSGRIRAKIRSSDTSYYPKWEPFDPNDLELVAELGARIKQVEWAADSANDIILSGVHLDGESIVATDRYRIARVPCKAEPIFRPITVPVGIFDPVIRTLGDAAVGISEGQFLVMPDISTQIRASTWGEKYPNLDRAFIRNQEYQVEIKKQDFLDMIARAMVFVGSERFPLLTMYTGREELAVMMSDKEMGLLGDVIELPGQAEHKRIKSLFTPKNLTEAVAASPSEKVTLHYPENPLKAIRIDGGSGYEAWVMPRKES